MVDISLAAVADQAVPIAGIGAGLSVVFAFAGILIKHVMASQAQSAAQMAEWRTLLLEEKQAHGEAERRVVALEAEIEKQVVRARECELRADTNLHRAETAEERVTMLTLQVAEQLRKIAERDG